MPSGAAADRSDRWTVDRELRRADWRFLLPSRPEHGFRHLVLLGGRPDLSDLVIRLGLARRVSREIPAKDSADALVLLNDAEIDLPTATRCLARGGVVYWEVQRRWPSVFLTTPRGIGRTLRRVGLTPLGIHWARPNFGRVAMYLPVGPRGVFPWYVRTLMDASTLPRRAARLLLKALIGRGGGWTHPLLPRFAVTAVSGPADRQPTAGSGTAVGAVWEIDSAPVVLLRGMDSYRRVIVFPFPADARYPASVVKLWRLPDRNPYAELEQGVLRQIRSALDPRTARSLPEPLGTFPYGESVAGVESYAPGRALSNRIGEWGRPTRRKLEDVMLVFHWIGEFHRQAQASCDPWTSAEIQRWVDEPCARYRSAVGDGPEEKRLFEAVRKRARALLGMRLPIVWAHRDLTGANVHVDAGRISVIDWSGATPRLPLYDLLYFVMLVTARLRRMGDVSGRLRCFRDLFVEPACGNAIVGTMKESIRRYMTDLEIDSRFFPVLLVLSWVFRSLECSERADAVASGMPGANPHPGESYVEYVRVLAEEVGRVFEQE